MPRGWCQWEEKDMRSIRLNKKPVLIGASLAIVCLIGLAHFAFWRERPCHLGYLQDSQTFRAFEYCNALGASHVGQEGTVPDTDTGYELESVYVAIRHGDRHSLHGIKNYDRVDIKCEIDEEVTVHMPIMKRFKTFMMTQQNKRLPSQTFATYDVFPNKPKCALAELTPIGAAQHVRNGLLFHKRYFKKLGLDTVENIYKYVSVRSTLWSRCYQSALALMYGFLGDYDLASLTIEEGEDNRMCAQSSGLPCKCAVMEADVDRMSSTYRQIFPDVMDRRETVAINQHIAEIFEVGMGEVPPVSNLYDVTMAHVCHALPLPAHATAPEGQCMAPWVVTSLRDVLDANAGVQAQSATLQKVTKLKMLPLLTEITRRMRNQAAGEEVAKFLLYSGHDTTISSLVMALGFGDGAWPPFASRIVFELYSRNKKGKQSDLDSALFVKVLFNGRSVTERMEWCAADITNGLCPYTVFRQYIEKGILESLSEASYKSACKKSSLTAR